MTHRMILPILTAALGASLLLLVAACQQGGDGPAAGIAAKNGAAVPTQQFFDYRLIESQAGVKQWILESAEMQQFSGQRDAILGDVHMDFFRDGTHFSVLTSDSGRANLYTKDIHAWGNVVIVTDDGRRLETSELFFNNETELIQNDVFNRFTRESSVMTGIGLEATPDLEYIELKRDVKAEVDDTSAPVVGQPPRTVNDRSPE